LVTAGVLFPGGVFSMLMGVVFGFAVFGLIFLGMMCVLPGIMSHPPTEIKDLLAAKEATNKAQRPRGISAFRSA
jgi:hypothetical protein